MEQVNSIKRYLDKLTRYDGYEEKYYRGQMEKYVTIPPSIARDEGYLANESEIYHDSIVMKEDEFALLESPLEKLSKLQHYGIPTRLVDVTIDPLYALYFAVEDIDDPSPGNVLVYIAEGHETGSEHARLLSLIATTQNKSLKKITYEFNQLYGASLTSEQVLSYAKTPIFIKHSDNLKRYNERLHSQKGAFLICGNEVDDNKILSILISLDNIKPNMSIRIPFEYKKQIKEELQRDYGINNVTVYPELPSVAVHIKNIYKKENIPFAGDYKIVDIENISFGIIKRISIDVVLSGNIRIDQVRAVASEVMNKYKDFQDVVWIYVAKTNEDYIMKNWILRGQWINPQLPERYRPLSLKEKSEEGYYWEYGESFSTMADYYNDYVFDDDRYLFVCHQKTFEEFLEIYNCLKESFDKDNLDNFLLKFSSYQKKIRSLYNTLGEMGHSKNIKFDSFLNNYSNAITHIDNIYFLIKNDKISDKRLIYQISTKINDAKKYIDIISNSSSNWRKSIGVTDEEYERIELEDREKPKYQYTYTLPIRENAIEVYFNVKVLVNEDKTFYIQGETNLFDRANLMVSVRKNNYLQYQGKADVSEGKFIFPKFSNKGNGVESGEYSANISLSLPDVQPKEFTKMAGIEYENLTGQYVNRDGRGPSVNYTFEFKI